MMSETEIDRIIDAINLRIDDNMRGIQKTIDDFKTSHEKEAQPLRESVGLLDKCIRGNGKVGLVERVGRVEGGQKITFWGLAVVIAAVVTEVIRRILGKG